MGQAVFLHLFRLNNFFIRSHRISDIILLIKPKINVSTIATISPQSQVTYIYNMTKSFIIKPWENMYFKSLIR